MTTSRVLSVEPNGPDTALAIGNFDGVHRGHQALIEYTLELAKRHGLRLRAMTFDPHPAEVFSGTPLPLLTTLERKIELLEGSAPGLQVLVQRFDREFAQLSPVEFVERVLIARNHVRQLVVGDNFHFGHDRAGTIDVLRELGGRYGFVAHGVPLSQDAGSTISSSRIRRLVIDGDVAFAAELLGRSHSLTGTVIQGDGRGRTIGYPTANLGDVAEVRPCAGVYASQAEVIENDGAARSIGLAVVHIGPRPTVDRGETIEAHVIGRSLDLYGKRLRLGLLQRLRGLVRFADIESLRQQIERDVAAAVGL